MGIRSPSHIKVVCPDISAKINLYDITAVDMHFLGLLPPQPGSGHRLPQNGLCGSIEINPGRGKMEQVSRAGPFIDAKAARRIISAPVASVPLASLSSARQETNLAFWRPVRVWLQSIRPNRQHIRPPPHSPPARSHRAAVPSGTAPAPDTVLAEFQRQRWSRP